MKNTTYYGIESKKLTSEELALIQKLYESFQFIFPNKAACLADGDSVIHIENKYAASCGMLYMIELSRDCYAIIVNSRSFRAYEVNRSEIITINNEDVSFSDGGIEVCSIDYERNVGFAKYAEALRIFVDHIKNSKKVNRGGRK